MELALANLYPGATSSWESSSAKKQKQSSSAEVTFQTAKARSKPKQKPVLEEAPQNRNNSDDDESCNDEGSDLFFYPQEGCVKSFVQYSSLQKHLDCG